MSEKKPTVSVIIPTYNRAHMVARAIQSVLSQTYQDFEIIVVDDASTDNTQEVVKEFMFRDKRVRYIKHEKNKGGSAARNTGIKNAQGEYIGFLDSDDEWLPTKLEKQIELFRKRCNSVGAVYCLQYMMDDSIGRIKLDKIYDSVRRGNVYRQALSGFYGGVGSPRTMLLRECFQKSGMFDESLPSLQDVDLGIRVAEHYNFELIDEPLVICHVEHGEPRISNDFNAKMRGLELFFEKWGSTIKCELGEQSYDSMRRKWLSAIYANAIIEDLKTLHRQNAFKKFVKMIKETGRMEPKSLTKMLIISIGGTIFYSFLKNLWKKITWKKIPPFAKNSIMKL